MQSCNMLRIEITCKDCWTLCAVMRQAGTVLSSSDHPLIAAVATFVGPADRHVSIPGMSASPGMQMSLVCGCLGMCGLISGLKRNTGILNVFQTVKGSTNDIIFQNFEKKTI